MLTVGDRLPEFKLKALVSTDPGREFAEVTHAHAEKKWLVLFAWPLDFTFVCPTEIAGFGQQYAAFQGRNAEVLGMSLDSEFVHLAWRRENADLKDLPFPMLADVKRELSTALGILHKQDGVPLRATFIVDPEGIIRFVNVNDLSAGRSVDEVLRVLDALQTGELCPVNWKRGQATLTDKSKVPTK
ncbi:MAG: peroxiredoxin [Polyangiaceae bacterium]